MVVSKLNIVLQHCSMLLPTNFEWLFKKIQKRRNKETGKKKGKIRKRADVSVL